LSGTMRNRPTPSGLRRPGRPANPLAQLTAYELRHLAEHLELSGRGADLHHLLKLETETRRNAWFDVRELGGDLEGYVADVARARALADRADAAQRRELQCRYALMQTSVRSLAENIPPPLMLALVGQRIWNLEQGLAYAAQIVSPAQRATVMCELITRVLEDQQPDLVRATIGVVETTPSIDVSDELTVLGRLFEVAPPAHREPALRRMLDLARAPTSYVTMRARSALIAAIPSMDLGGVREAMSVWTSDGEDPPVQLVVRLQEPERSRVAARLLRSSRRAANEHAEGGLAVSTFAWELVTIRDHLPALVSPELVQEALVLALQTTETVFRDEALRDLLPHLTPVDQRDVLERLLADWLEKAPVEKDFLTSLARATPAMGDYILDVVRGLADRRRRNTSLLEIGPYLDQRQRDVVVDALLEDVRLEGDAAWFVFSFPEIAPLLSPQRAQHIIRWANEALDGLPRARILVGAAARLSPTAQRRTLAEAESLIENQRANLPDPWSIGYWSEVEALVACAALLTQSARERILREILHFASTLRDSSDNTKGFLSKLAPILPPTLIQSAVALARSLNDEPDWLEALPRLVPYLTPSGQDCLLRLVLNTAKGIDREWRAGMWIAAAAPNLTQSLIGNALEAARGFVQPGLRATALTALVPRLNQALQETVAAEAADDARHALEPRFHAEHLAKLAGVALAGQRDRLVAEALAVLETLTVDRRITPLLSLLPVLDDQTRCDLAARTVQLLESSGDNEQEICQLIPFLCEQTVRDALALPIWFAAPGQQRRELLVKYTHRTSLPESILMRPHGRILGALVLRLAGLGFAAEAFEIMCISRRENSQLWAIVTLASVLPMQLIPRAAEVARTLIESGASFTVYGESSEWTLSQAEAREFALAALCPLIARAGDIESAFTQARTISDPLRRAEALAGIGRATFDAKHSKNLEALIGEVLDCTRKIDDTAYRTARAREMLLDMLAPVAAELPQSELERIWRELLRYLTTRTRAQLVSELCHFAPALAAAAGAEGCDEVVRSLEDVARWWP
jgi:hypothetical protein